MAQLRCFPLFSHARVLLCQNSVLPFAGNGSKFVPKRRLETWALLVTKDRIPKANMSAAIYTCSKRFADACVNELRNTNDSPLFICKFCNVGFRTKSSLDRHLRIHTEKPFKCDACGAAYVTQRGLDLHNAAIHVRAFPCAVAGCGRAFATKSALARHAVVHISEVSIQCKKCKSRKERGEKEKAPEADVEKGSKKEKKRKKGYPCEECGLTFNKKEYAGHPCVVNLFGASPDALTVIYRCRYCGAVFCQKEAE